MHLRFSLNLLKEIWIFAPYFLRRRYMDRSAICRHEIMPSWLRNHSKVLTKIESKWKFVYKDADQLCPGGGIFMKINCWELEVSKIFPHPYIHHRFRVKWLQLKVILLGVYAMKFYYFNQMLRKNYSGCWKFASSSSSHV